MQQELHRVQAGDAADPRGHPAGGGRLLGRAPPRRVREAAVVAEGPVQDAVDRVDLGQDDGVVPLAEVQGGGGGGGGREGAERAHAFRGLLRPGPAGRAGRRQAPPNLRPGAEAEHQHEEPDRVAFGVRRGEGRHRGPVLARRAQLGRAGSQRLLGRARPQVQQRAHRRPVPEHLRARGDPRARPRSSERVDARPRGPDRRPGGGVPRHRQASLLQRARPAVAAGLRLARAIPGPQAVARGHR
mmetsp:Transcript_121710/g.344956  ORF Transcript_121710/g.344956 Transcript_121710/m.344956 type:complete len:243 (+) Transcript_121710:1280-2008(+)